MTDERVRVLLVEDDEDDYIITLSLFAEMKAPQFELDWVPSYWDGLEATKRGEHDIYLVDYRLGTEHGTDLIRDAIAQGCTTPLILITGYAYRDLEDVARRAGAADFLIKSQTTAVRLKGALCGALERKQAARAGS